MGISKNSRKNYFIINRPFKVNKISRHPFQSLDVDMFQKEIKFRILRTLQIIIDLTYYTISIVSRTSKNLVDLFEKNLS